MALLDEMTGENGRKIYYENYSETAQGPIPILHISKTRKKPMPVAICDDIMTSLGNVLTYEKAPDGVRVILYLCEKGKDWLTRTGNDQRWSGAGQSYLYLRFKRAIILTSNQTVNDPATMHQYERPTYTRTMGGGRLASQTAWNGQQTSYAYDKFGRLSESTVSGSGISQTTRYTYDAYNHPASRRPAERGSSDIT